jgi:hypothetical protein
VTVRIHGAAGPVGGERPLPGTAEGSTSGRFALSGIGVDCGGATAVVSAFAAPSVGVGGWLDAAAGEAKPSAASVGTGAIAGVTCVSAVPVAKPSATALLPLSSIVADVVVTAEPVPVAAAPVGEEAEIEVSVAAASTESEPAVGVASVWSDTTGADAAAAGVAADASISLGAVEAVDVPTGAIITVLDASEGAPASSAGAP